MSQHRRNGQKRDEPRRRGPFRPFFLVVIVLAVGWAFWTNNERRLNSMIERSLFTDETHTVSAEQRDQLLLYLKPFKKDFGIPLEVNVRTTPPSLHTQDRARMYIDIVPSQGRAYLSLPPLVRHAVGPEFIRDMERSFAQDFAAGDWRVSLVPAVLALRSRLAEVTR